MARRGWQACGSFAARMVAIEHGIPTV